ncbi:hypothetical protein [Aquisphaera giovannonii]|uniref:hypothetical protein n=1 Tax=Aquisphaera giovannonii TaxID=406548 RepID=UPI0011DFA8C7|nr:hypothetical protein [Aquisphaera giovannonii]
MFKVLPPSSRSETDLVQPEAMLLEAAWRARIQAPSTDVNFDFEAARMHAPARSHGSRTTIPPPRREEARGVGAKLPGLTIAAVAFLPSGARDAPGIRSAIAEEWLKPERISPQSVVQIGRKEWACVCSLDQLKGCPRPGISEPAKCSSLQSQFEVQWAIEDSNF